MNTTGKLPKFTMAFEPMTIDHLGHRMYSSLPPVISEMVSNSYDADSPRVEITIPSGKLTPESELIVRDYGHGLNGEEIQNEYLPIGRARRGPESTNVKSRSGKRYVTGRKGLGKLSAFGAAIEMDVRSIQNKKSICLRINYEKMKQWSIDHPGMDFEPEVVPELSRNTNEKTGIIVTLRQLRRKSPLVEDEIRRGLARRLPIIGAGFKVSVNGKEVGPGDRVDRSLCPEGFAWDVANIPTSGNVEGGKNVTGWIGFLAQSSHSERGIDLFAHGKAVELGTFFGLPSTHAQYARAYLVGEIHADFLDEEEDLASTARNSALWDEEFGQALKNWGQAALKWAFAEWLKARQKQKETAITSTGNFDVWLAARPAGEQIVARRLVKILVDDPDLEPESAKSLLEIVKVSVESIAFRELVDRIDDEGVSVKTLLKLFDEWRIIEAREHLKLGDGRLAALEQLATHMDSGALEVTELQPVFDEHPWLIDAAWKQADRQQTYTTLMRKKCKEPTKTKPEDRRLDIFVISHSGIATIVELKHPKKKLSRIDLEQIEKYTDWARPRLISSGKDSIKYVHGLLLVGELNASQSQKMARLAGSDIRVETYSDLHARSREYYERVDKALMETAPEYARTRRKTKVAAPSTKSASKPTKKKSSSPPKASKKKPNLH